MSFKTISEVMTPLANAVRAKNGISGTLSVDEMKKIITEETCGMIKLVDKTSRLPSLKISASPDPITNEIMYGIGEYGYYTDFDITNLDLSFKRFGDVYVEMGGAFNNSSIPDGSLTPYVSSNSGPGMFQYLDVEGDLTVLHSHGLSFDSSGFSAGTYVFYGMNVTGTAIIDITSITNTHCISGNFGTLRFPTLSSISAPLSRVKANAVRFDHTVAFSNNAFYQSDIKKIFICNTSGNTCSLDTANLGSSIEAVYVPRGWGSIYKSLTNWSAFSSIINELETSASTPVDYDEEISEILSGSVS